jgi:hypothetical protein
MVGDLTSSLVRRLMKFHSGAAGLEDRRKSLFPKRIKIAIQCSRIPLAIGAILIVAGACVLILTLFQVGSVTLLVGFVYLAAMTLWVAQKHDGFDLAPEGTKALWALIASFPFFVIRLVYLMLVEFGDFSYNPVFGGWGYLVGLDLFPELCVMILLIVATWVVEPLTGEGTTTSKAGPENVSYTDV